MNNIIIRTSLVLLVVLFATVGCEEKYKYIDYKKIEAEELALLNDFYDSPNAAWDSILALSIDTIDNRNSTGLMYLKMTEGTGDSALVGKQVGFRYTYYGLFYNNDNEPTLSPIQSNVNDASPQMYTVGSPPESLYRGIDFGIRNMRNFGKSTFIMPSRISTERNYITVVADIELVFVQLD